MITKILKTTFVISSLILALSVLSCNKQIKGEIKVISPEEMQTFLQLDNVQFIDVRTPKEHDSIFIPKSQNIDFFSPTFLEDIEKLDKNQSVLLYCKSGNRSRQCAQKMLEAGFVKIYELQGGISKWEHDGFETATNR